jgi:hypothetical protein
VFIHRRRPFGVSKSHWTRESEIQDREVAQPYKGVGGLHKVVSKMILSLFVDNRQKEKGGKLV